MSTTLHTENCGGIPILVPNVTESRDKFYISYNNYDLHIYGSDTTAVCLEETSYFMILNGDHREGLKGSFEDCLKYLNDHKDQKNKISDSFPSVSSYDEALAFAKAENKRRLPEIYGK